MAYIVGPRNQRTIELATDTLRVTWSPQPEECQQIDSGQFWLVVATDVSRFISIALRSGFSHGIDVASRNDDHTPKKCTSGRT